MEDILNVGIIGTGRHGTRYAEHIINDMQEIKLKAISRRSSSGKNQSNKWGVSYYQNWNELIKDKNVDAVISVTTPNLNFNIAESCIKHSKPLLLEKPIAINSNVASKIVDMFEKANLPLTICQTLRYNPIIKGLKNYILNLGSLYLFHASHRLENIKHDWLDNPEIAGGGISLYTVIHVFDALRFITGKEFLKVNARFFHRNHSSLENLLTVMIEMEDGLVGTIDGIKLGSSRSSRYEFIGENGQLHGDQIHGSLKLIENTQIKSLPETDQIPTILHLLKDWYTYLKQDGINPIPGDEGLSAVKISDACKKSAEKKKWVNIN